MPSDTSATIQTRKRSDVSQVIQLLDNLCASLRPGDRVPTHTALMRQFQASERTVLRALDELQRAGKIVRRNGVGTFVTERQRAVRSGAPTVPSVAVDSRTVVAIAKPDQSFFDRCMELLYGHVQTADLSLVCQLIDPHTRPVLTPPLASNRPLGFILFRYDLAPLAKQLQEAGCHVVLVGAPPADVTPEVPCVYGDHERGGYLATRHLLDLGHRRIAFVGDYNLQQTLRWQGHMRALREAQRKRRGEEIHAAVVLPNEVADWTKEPKLAADYVRRPDAPTGFVVWNDHQAAALLAVFTRAGVKVPEEASLVGYDALPAGELVYPPLTTLDSSIDQQLHAALSLLTRPTPPPPTYTVVVLPSLVPRESCAPPRSAA